MMDQRDWQPPDWIVLPGGNLGNTSAFGKGLREMYELGLIDRDCRAWLSCRPKARPRSTSTCIRRGGHLLSPSEHPETLATAIKIGDPVSWPKAQFEVETTNGVVERVTRTGNRRCQGHHRPMRHRLRARFRRNPRRYSQTHRGRGHRA